MEDGIRKGDGTYVVRYEPAGDGWWTATVESVPGCLTQGRSLRQTRKRIRKALSLCVDDWETAELVNEIDLGKVLHDKVLKVTTLHATRKTAVTAHAKALEATARALGKKGLSSRDTAELLGVSQQRVSQLRSS